MAYWLLKTEPSEVSWDDLVRDQRAAWDGVANPVAKKHKRAAAPRHLALLYHTGDERAAVGIADVASAPREDGGEVVFDVKPRKKLAEPVALATIKDRAEFADSPLVKMGRLSVVPLTPAQWKAL